VSDIVLGRLHGEKVGVVARLDDATNTVIGLAGINLSERDVTITIYRPNGTIIRGPFILPAGSAVRRNVDFGNTLTRTQFEALSTSITGEA